MLDRRLLAAGGTGGDRIAAMLLHGNSKARAQVGEADAGTGPLETVMQVDVQARPATVMEPRQRRNGNDIGDGPVYQNRKVERFAIVGRNLVGICHTFFDTGDNAAAS